MKKVFKGCTPVKMGGLSRLLQVFTFFTQQPTGHLTITCARGRGLKGFFLDFCCGYFKLRYCSFTKPSGLQYLEIFEPE